MIPSSCPPGTASAAERRLFEVLKDGLDRHFTVIHSLPWLSDDERRLQEGECDFLIVHPAHGILAIEAKSGDVGYDGLTRTWLRDDGVEIKDPFLQAQRSVHYLCDLLSRRIPAWCEATPAFGYAVAFPGADRFRGSLPPHAKMALLILEPDLDEIQTRIEDIFSEWGSSARSLKPDEFQNVLRVLLPRFQVSTPLSGQVAEQRSALFRLTQRQIDFLNAARSNPRLILEGCAGSGKSVLAVEVAVWLAEQGCRVLLLCFNIPLVKELSSQVVDRGASIDVYHYHGLCEAVIRSADPNWNLPVDPDSPYWEEELPQLFSDSIGESTPRYDAIVVDEAQDIAGHWWVPLEELSNPACRLYIFRDENQNIYNRSNELPYIDIPRFHLPHNCRNTIEIAKVAFRFAGLDLPDFPDPVQGKEPEFIDVTDDREEREEIRKRIHELVNVGGLRTEQIVILGKRSFKNSAFAEHPTLGRFEVVDSTEPGSETQIRYVTVYRFKGLDADCVFLTGVESGDLEDMVAAERAFWYVGASRARVLLFVLRKVGVESRSGSS